VTEHSEKHSRFERWFERYDERIALSSSAALLGGVLVDQFGLLVLVVANFTVMAVRFAAHVRRDRRDRHKPTIYDQEQEQ